MKLQRLYKKVKLYELTYFLVKNTKYKTIQPLVVWGYKDLTRRKRAETCISHTVTFI